MKNFWIFSLCVFLLAAVNLGLSLPLRVAIAANAVIVLFDVAKQAWGWLHGRRSHKAEA